jgi:hypothetical protein
MAKAKPVVSATDKRKPPPLRSEVARAKFVSGGTAKQEKDREKLTVYIESGVLTTLRVFCARERRELSEVTTEALRKLLVGQDA